MSSLTLILLFPVFMSAAVFGNAFGGKVLNVENTGSKKLIGGTIVDNKIFPYQVSVKRGYSFICGGAIISDLHILSSAHCARDVIKPPYTNYHVISRNFWSGEIHDVAYVRIHPQFTSIEICENTVFLSNDVAVIILLKPMRYNSFQKPVRLPTSKPNPGTNSILTGWGTLKFGREPAAQLHATRMRTLSIEQCRPFEPKITSQQICANNNELGVGTGIGDSGSPLVFDNVVIGVASYKTDTSGTGSPDVYTDVYSYLHFINEVIAGDGGNTTYEDDESENCSPTARSYLEQAFVPAWEDEKYLKFMYNDYRMSEDVLKQNNLYIENRHLPIVPLSCETKYSS